MLESGEDGVVRVLGSMGGDLRVDNAAESNGKTHSNDNGGVSQLHGMTIQGSLVVRMIDESNTCGCGEPADGLQSCGMLRNSESRKATVSRAWLRS